MLLLFSTSSPVFLVFDFSAALYQVCFTHLNICLGLLINSFLLQASDFLVMKWQFAATRQLCLDSVIVREWKEHWLPGLWSAMHEPDLVSC